jgi:hypothetical protein
VEYADVVVQIPFVDERAAVVEVALVDIYAHDIEILRFDQLMVFLDHDAVSDSDIEDPRIFREIIERVVVAVIGYVIDYKLIEIISHQDTLYQVQTRMRTGLTGMVMFSPEYV